MFCSQSAYIALCTESLSVFLASMSVTDAKAALAQVKGSCVVSGMEGGESRMVRHIKARACKFCMVSGSSLLCIKKATVSWIYERSVR